MANLIQKSAQPITSFRSELDRMLEQFLSGLEIPTEFTRASDFIGQSVWTPKVDITEDAVGYRLHAELPGLSKKDIHVRIEENVLTLEGERRDERKQDENKDGFHFHRSERSFGKFYRSFRLPTGVDAQKAEAKFLNGVLEVRLPKTDDVRPRTIEVKLDEATEVAPAN